MAVAVSVTGTAVHNTGAATQTFTFTTNSGDSLAVFFIFQDSATSNAISSVTWDQGGTNQACTLIKQQQMTTTGNGAISAYAVVNPTAGTKTLQVVQALGQQMAANSESYTGTVTTSVAAACTNALSALGSSGVAQAGTQTGTAGDMLVSAYGTINTFASLSDNTIFNFVANVRNSAANRAVSTGAANPLTANLTATAQWCAVSFDIVASGQSGTATTGGTVFSSDVIFTWQLIYQAKTEPVFVFTPAVVNNGWFAPWPDSAPKARPVVDFIPWSFIPPPAQVWFPPIPWPDFLLRPKPAADFKPWSFIPSPAQVFFPYAPWDDFTRRKPQPLDTQPLIWTGQPIAAPAPVMAWTNWPDFAPKARPPLNFDALALVQPVPQVFFPYGPWDDFTRRRPQYPDTQPLAWTGQNIAAPAPIMAWTNWPDFAPKKPVPLNFDSLALVQLAPQIWYPPVQWPDIIYKKPVPLNFTPLTLTQLAPQVWFPYGPWDDFTRRKPQPLDTQPLAWNNFTPPPGFFLVPDRWPDFVRAKAVPLNYNPLTLVQTVTAPWTMWTQWPDRIWRKAPPVDTGPFTAFLQIARTPWNEMSHWPDFAPIRGKAGLHAALQAFAARFPGTITQAAITGVMSAFETNSDTAAFTIYVVQSQPAVSAAISIQEIGP